MPLVLSCAANPNEVNQGSGGSGTGGSGGTMQTNQDECALGTHNCSVNATCTDTADGFTCTCNPGFMGDGQACVPEQMPCLNGQKQCVDTTTAAECIGGTWTNKPCVQGMELCQNGDCVACEGIQFTIQTKQACALSIAPGFQVDGEGFIHLAGADYRVFAMDRWGAGHIIAWCDSTTNNDLLNAFNVIGYLGQVDPARVASFGDNYLCNPGTIPESLPSSVTYLGDDLPAVYDNDPAALAADWDVLVICGFRIPWTNDWSAEIGAFVSQYGKGLLAMSDYEGVVTAQDFANMTAITSPAGIIFEPLNLPWAPTSTSVVLECVPDVVPVPK